MFTWEIISCFRFNKFILAETFQHPIQAKTSMDHEVTHESIDKWAL